MLFNIHMYTQTNQIKLKLFTYLYEQIYNNIHKRINKLNAVVHFVTSSKLIQLTYLIYYLNAYIFSLCLFGGFVSFALDVKNENAEIGVDEVGIHRMSLMVQMFHLENGPYRFRWVYKTVECL